MSSYRNEWRPQIVGSAAKGKPEVRIFVDICIDNSTIGKNYFVVHNVVAYKASASREKRETTCRKSQLRVRTLSCNWFPLPPNVRSLTPTLDTRPPVVERLWSSSFMKMSPQVSPAPTETRLWSELSFTPFIDCILIITPLLMLALPAKGVVTTTRNRKSASRKSMKHR